MFIAGNGLPQRWQNRETLTILETGFGLGLNFLATWDAFRCDQNSADRLHFVSVEKHPFDADDLRELHSRWADLAILSAGLVAAWPPLVAGFHRLHFDGGRVTLTLLLGDATDLLPQLTARVDCFFLDGFAPAKNPDLWSAALFRELARLAAPGATFATYTVAASVRDGLRAAGFATEKRAGFASKREMLVGQWPESGRGVTDSIARHAIVIGAGLAGTAAAERLAARGWHVDIIERQDAVARGASGNSAGVLHPLVHVDDTPGARLSRAAFLYAVRHLNTIANESGDLIWGPDGLLHLAIGENEATRFAQIAERHRFPEALLRMVDTGDAARLAGNAVGGPGIWFPCGAWVNPPSLCAANLARSAEPITRHFNQQAARLRQSDDGWIILAENGAVIAAAPIVILANAADCARIAELNLPIRPVRGQITHLPPLKDRHLDITVTGDGYVSPRPGGGYSVGATFQRNDTGTDIRMADHAKNLTGLDAMMPGFAAGTAPRDLEGRVAFRSTTPDRLPLIGELQAGLYTISGLGARGLLWAMLGGELLASRICGEPSPVEQSLSRAVAPTRFSRKPP